MKGGVLMTNHPDADGLLPPDTSVTYYGPAVHGARNELPPVFQPRALNLFNRWLFEEYLGDRYYDDLRRHRRLPHRLMRDRGTGTFVSTTAGRPFILLVGRT